VGTLTDEYLPMWTAEEHAPRPRRSPTRAVLVCGLAATALGVTEIVAWCLHVTVLLRLRPSYDVTVFDMAVALAVTGAGVALAARGRLRWLRVAGGVDVGLGVLTLIEHAWGRSLGFDQLFVRAYVPETELGLCHVGDTVPFTVDTFTGHDFHAIVQHVNDVGEYTPRNVQTVDERANQVYLVRLGVADGQDHLRAGMAVTLRLPRRHP